MVNYNILVLASFSTQNSRQPQAGRFLLARSLFFTYSLIIYANPLTNLYTVAWFSSFVHFGHKTYQLKLSGDFLLYVIISECVGQLQNDKRFYRHTSKCTGSITHFSYVCPVPHSLEMMLIILFPRAIYSCHGVSWWYSNTSTLWRCLGKFYRGISSFFWFSVHKHSHSLDLWAQKLRQENVI